MPYRRRRRRKRRYTRASAASTLQSAWRRRARRKRGGLVARTAKANFKAIKSLKKTRELKFNNNGVCTARTQWCGQILTNQVVDNMGYPSDMTTYAAAGPAGTQLPDSAFLPLIMQPWLIPQAGYQPTGAPPQPEFAVGEKSRVGNWVQHVNTTFKITLQGSRCDLNRGDYQYVAQKQKLRVYFILDNEPTAEPASLNTTVPTFDVTRIPCRLYQPAAGDTLVANNLSSQILNAVMPGFDNIRSGPLISSSTPPGINIGNLSTLDLHGVSYYSKDNIGAKSRFKVLKVIEMHCNQQDTSVNPDSGSRNPMKHVAYRTVTIKSPWKLHWAGDTAYMPDNKNLLVAFASDTPTPANALASPPLLSTSYVAAPTVSCVARVQFKDP